MIDYLLLNLGERSYGLCLNQHELTIYKNNGQFELDELKSLDITNSSCLLCCEPISLGEDIDGSLDKSLMDVMNETIGIDISTEGEHKIEDRLICSNCMKNQKELNTILYLKSTLFFNQLKIDLEKQCKELVSYSPDDAIDLGKNVVQQLIKHNLIDIFKKDVSDVALLAYWFGAKGHEALLEYDDALLCLDLAESQFTSIENSESIESKEEESVESPPADSEFVEPVPIVKPPPIHTVKSETIELPSGKSLKINVEPTTPAPLNISAPPSVSLTITKDDEEEELILPSLHEVFAFAALCYYQLKNMESFEVKAKQALGAFQNNHVSDLIVDVTFKYCKYTNHLDDYELLLNYLIEDASYYQVRLLQVVTEMLSILVHKNAFEEAIYLILDLDEYIYDETPQEYDNYVSILKQQPDYESIMIKRKQDNKLKRKKSTTSPDACDSPMYYNPLLKPEGNDDPYIGSDEIYRSKIAFDKLFYEAIAKVNIAQAKEALLYALQTGFQLLLKFSHKPSNHLDILKKIKILYQQLHNNACFRSEDLLGNYVTQERPLLYKSLRFGSKYFHQQLLDLDEEELPLQFPKSIPRNSFMLSYVMRDNTYYGKGISFLLYIYYWDTEELYPKPPPKKKSYFFNKKKKEEREEKPPFTNELLLEKIPLDVSLMDLHSLLNEYQTHAMHQSLYHNTHSDINQSMEQFMEYLQEQVEKGEHARSIEVLKTLYQVLLPSHSSKLQALLKNRSRIFIIPDDILFTTPFTFLIGPDNKYFFEHFDLSVCFSVDHFKVAVQDATRIAYAKSFRQNFNSESYENYLHECYEAFDDVIHQDNSKFVRFKSWAIPIYDDYLTIEEYGNTKLKKKRSINKHRHMFYMYVENESNTPELKKNLSTASIKSDFSNAESDLYWNSQSYMQLLTQKSRVLYAHVGKVMKKYGMELYLKRGHATFEVNETISNIVQECQAHPSVIHLDLSTCEKFISQREVPVQLLESYASFPSQDELKRAIIDELLPPTLPQTSLMILTSFSVLQQHLCVIDHGVPQFYRDILAKGTPSLLGCLWNVTSATIHHAFLNLFLEHAMGCHHLDSALSLSLRDLIAQYPILKQAPYVLSTYSLFGSYKSVPLS